MIIRRKYAQNVLNLVERAGLGIQGLALGGRGGGALFIIMIMIEKIE